MDEAQASEYPLLEAILRIKRNTLLPMYTNADVANLFGVSVRTVQAHAADGKLQRRKLIGRYRYLATDSECFLREIGSPTS